MFKRILITGGTGSLGHALTAFLVAHTDATILILSRDEFKQFVMRQQYGDTRLRYFLGDVRDLARMTLALQGVDLCIHTAALKYVDVGEYNPTEVLATNVTGTQNVITACLVNGVQRAVLISSDKAVESRNLYGHSKACAERLWTRANGYAPHGTAFVTVRYGNVTGSRASVVPLWRQQVAAGVPPSLTALGMSRFWLTLSEAVQHVWWTACYGPRGSITVPHLPAYNVEDLCAAVTDLEPVFIGVRPGEKMAECLVTDTELSGATMIRALPEGTPLYYSIPAVAPSWVMPTAWLPLPDMFVQPYSGTTRYVSDTWPWRLYVPTLKTFLEKKETRCDYTQSGF